MFKTIGRYYIGGLIVILPFLITPFGGYPAYDSLVLCLSGMGGIISAGLLAGKRTITVSSCDFLFGLLALVMLASALINRSYGSGITTAITAVFYLQVYLIARNADIARIFGLSVLVSAFFQAIIAYGQLFGIIQSINFYYPVTGSFHSPASLGCLLGLGTVVSLNRMVHAPKKRWPYLLCLLFLMGGLLISRSRAAWFATALGSIYVLWEYPRVRLFALKYRLHILFPVVGLIILAGLYLIRPDSADGRLLVWRVSSEVVMQKPLLGHGPGSFSSVYPLAQGEFFKTHPESHFAALADDITTPFNEYLSIAIQFGVLGLLVFGALLWFTVRRATNRLPVAILIGLCVFGFFSYPFIQLLFIVVLTAGIGCCSNGGIRMNLPHWIVVTLVVIWLPGIIWYATLLVHHKPITYQHSKEYLGKYAKDLYERQEYDSVAQLFHRIPSSTLSTDLAKAYTIQGEYSKALSFARLSADMVPNRTMPYYLLFRIYERQQLIDSAAYYARVVWEMPSKVDNTTTLKAKREAREYLRKLYEK